MELIFVDARKELWSELSPDSIFRARNRARPWRKRERETKLSLSNFLRKSREETLASVPTPVQLASWWLIRCVTRFNEHVLFPTISVVSMIPFFAARRYQRWLIKSSRETGALYCFSKSFRATVSRVNVAKFTGTGFCCSYAARQRKKEKQRRGERERKFCFCHFSFARF